MKLRLCYILIILMLLPVKGRSTVDFISYTIGHNLKLEMMPYDEDCERMKIVSLYFAIQDIQALLKNDSTFINIVFGNEYTKNILGISYSGRYCIGYSQSIYPVIPEPDTVGYYNKIYPTINIYCNDEHFSLRNILTLVYYGLTQTKDLRDKQEILLVNDSYQMAPINTISAVLNEADVQAILKKEYPELNNIIGAKYYSHWFNCNAIEFYIQNGKYYIYKRTNPCSSNDLREGSRPYPKLGKILLKADNIYNIVSSATGHNFIFTSDTTMYFTAEHDTTLKGPYHFRIPQFFDLKSHISTDSAAMVQPGIFSFSVRNYYDYNLLFDTIKGKFFLDAKSIDRAMWWYAFAETRHLDTLGTSKSALLTKQKKRTNQMLILAAVVVLSTVVLASNKKF